MTRICNFPITEFKRCTQPVADDKPNCGRHKCEISADQLGQSPIIYQKNGEVHVWTGEPDNVYCIIHSDPTYQALYKSEGKNPPSCLQRDIEYMDEDGHYHRDDGPAWIRADGAQIWYQHGERHRDDGPAFIWADGTQEWWQHGEVHRDDGPAVVLPGGVQIWRQHGEWHRDDGPAVIFADGAQIWFQHGEIHREDGPTFIAPDGTQHWYWHGKEVTKKKHAKLRNSAIQDGPVPSAYVLADDASGLSPSVSCVTRIIGDKQPLYRGEMYKETMEHNEPSIQETKRSID